MGTDLISVLHNNLQRKGRIMNNFWVIFLVLAVKVHTKSFVRRAAEDEAVAPPSSYLPSVEYEEDLPGYNSVDAYAGAEGDLPGYDPSDEVTTDASETDDTTTEAATTDETTAATEEMETTTLIGYNAGADDLEEDTTTEASADEEDSNSDTTEETTNSTDEDDSKDTEAPSGEASEAFKTYSSLSPAISICPGGTVEECVGVCPGSSPRVYGACVQGCADRCGEQP